MATDTPHRVVITGMGALTDLGHDARSTWDAMREGRSGIRRITDEEPFSDYTGWSTTIAGQVRGWDPLNILEKRELRRYDRSSLLGIGAADEAVAHAGWDPNSGDPRRHGVIIGSGIGGIYTIEESSLVMFNKGPGRISPFTVPRLMANAIAGNLSIRFGLQGPASTHATACASAGHAISDAIATIRSGKVDVMLAGGAEAAVTPLCLGAFMTMKALSTRNDDPERASRPFDEDRDGFVLAEGAAMFVLESETHAKKRGATIYAELTGCANSCDASHITAPDPEGRGAMTSMRWALEDAGLDPADIDYINAHGTSTPLGDKAEVLAVRSVFGERAAPGGRQSDGGLAMSSTKAAHGHTLGASGAIELIACIHAVRDGVIAPTINLDRIDPACAGVDIVANTARQTPCRHVMNNTFGFGGHNVSLICSRYG